MSEADLAAVWARSLDELAEMHIEPAQRAWLQLTRPLGLVENTALIATPNEFVKEQLETRLRSLITNALSRELGRSIQLAVTVDPAVISSLPSPDRDRDLDRGRDLGGRDGTGLGQPGTDRGQPAGPGGGPPMDHRHGQEPDAPLSAGGLGAGGLSAGGLSSGGIDPVTGRPRPMSTPGQLGQGPGPGFGALGTGPGHGHSSGLGPQGGLASAPPRPDEAQPEVHLRDLRHRLQQPVCPRCRRRGRRSSRQGLQPALRLRRLRAGQDAPAARDRPLRAEPLSGHPRALRELGRVHQRFHQHDPRRQAGRLPPPLPRRGRPPGGRHPVPGEQGRNPGGVLPHVQHPAQRQQADRHLQRPCAEAPGHPGGQAAQPVRVGPADRRPAARAGDPDRDPPQEGRPGTASTRRPRPWSTSPAASPPTSANSRAP